MRFLGFQIAFIGMLGFFSLEAKPPQIRCDGVLKNLAFPEFVFPSEKARALGISLSPVSLWEVSDTGAKQKRSWKIDSSSKIFGDLAALVENTFGISIVVTESHAALNGIDGIPESTALAVFNSEIPLIILNAEDFIKNLNSISGLREIEDSILHEAGHAWLKLIRERRITHRLDGMFWVPSLRGGWSRKLEEAYTSSYAFGSNRLDNIEAQDGELHFGGMSYDRPFGELLIFLNELLDLNLNQFQIPLEWELSSTDLLDWNNLPIRKIDGHRQTYFFTIKNGQLLVRSRAIGSKKKLGELQLPLTSDFSPEEMKRIPEAKLWAILSVVSIPSALKNLHQLVARHHELGTEIIELEEKIKREPSAHLLSQRKTLIEKIRAHGKSMIDAPADFINPFESWRPK